MKISIGLFIIVSFVSCSVDWSDDELPEKWNKLAQVTIEQLINKTINQKIAKNIILFIGDGMGVGTVTAGRIRKGQLKGQNGEETVTNIESLDNVAISKTYNIDSQTADSAGTATAFLCGVKTKAGIIGLNGLAKPFNCSSSHGNKIDSILKWANKAGKSTGIVTTTRITHATPAAAYAHSAFRDWETLDGIKFTDKIKVEGCKDIAAQLIEDNSFINVIFGGGRLNFIPSYVLDPVSKKYGLRKDNRNLLREWVDKMSSFNRSYKFMWNATDFRETNFHLLDYVLGLFAYDHLKYEAERNHNLEPSISEMTLKAIDVLGKNKNGYFLLVEGGRIDHGHHINQAQKAIDDFVALDNAVGSVLKKVSLEDTLVVVTGDHSHPFTLGGNSLRGNPIFGLALTSYVNISDRNLTYTSLLYGNGPGGLLKIRDFNLTTEETQKLNYTQEASVYRKMSTHSGEDVPIYASGPMSFLFTNTIEQNIIPHMMAYSACIGPYTNKKCIEKRGVVTNSEERVFRYFLLNFNNFSNLNGAIFSAFVFLLNNAFVLSVF